MDRRNENRHRAASPRRTAIQGTEHLPSDARRAVTLQRENGHHAGIPATSALRVAIVRHAGTSPVSVHAAGTVRLVGSSATAVYPAGTVRLAVISAVAVHPAAIVRLAGISAVAVHPVGTVRHVEISATAVRPAGIVRLAGISAVALHPVGIVRHVAIPAGAVRPAGIVHCAATAVRRVANPSAVVRARFASALNQTPQTFPYPRPRRAARVERRPPVFMVREILPRSVRIGNSPRLREAT